MANTNSSAVFFLGTRAHYQVLDPETYDSGNTSTETLCQNDEQLWKDQGNESPNCNQSGWCYGSDINVNFDTGVKKRLNRHDEATSDIDPALLNMSQESDLEKDKPRRKFLSFLSSLTRRKRQSNVQYLQHLENVLTTCTYRESCRCLDCQSRYFEYDSEPEDVSEDDEMYAYSYSVQDQSEVMADDDSNEELFLSYNEDNTSTDLLIDDPETMTTVSSSSEEPEEKRTELEVAASTSAVLNVLLFHPACIVQ
ncbi:uncharacterized protein LOC125062159 [Pieris napi]|nr:uncharacterized protein LOC125062159 [Pieris napi]